MGTIPTPLAARLWAKVDVRGPDDCWPWIGGSHGNGYGRLFLGPGSRERVYAHRAAWIVTHGPIPVEMLVCHRCDNPPCCNPGHLFLGTPEDNTQDGISKKRVLVGAKNGHFKLSDEDVSTIRRLYAAGGVTQSGLARRFGVRSSYISTLTSGRSRRATANAE
jgi:hypothetical protein